MINILFTLERIGPYHNARFNKVSESKDFNLNVLETNNASNEYPWSENLNKNYKVFELFRINSLNYKLNNYIKVYKILNESAPKIVFISGWNDRISHFLLFICQIKKIPIVILSDSRYKDNKRNIILEFIKKLLLKGCCSAIVAGKESENYLIRLGFKKSDIFKPYNVVDNQFFLCSNNCKRLNKYIICVARFLKRKNHLKLLKAFESYKKKDGFLDLILIGDGPERENIINFKKTLSCSSKISIEAWKDISELKEYYSNAKVFVLLSNVENWGLVINEAMASSLPCIVSYECGCYVDLIKDKNTGWGVDPENEEQLANIFQEIDKISERELIERQSNCLNIINDYSLGKFYDAVEDATLFSLEKRSFSTLSLLTALLLSLLK